MEVTDKKISVLDGDVVRQMLSSELGFSEAHRQLNIRRIGFVASEVVRPGGVAIAALIAPYRSARESARQFVTQHGGFIEVHVSTPLEECEKRDRKGLYKKARQGLIPNFTGISDPYEEPLKPEVTVDTSKVSVMEAVDRIVDYLRQQGYLLAAGSESTTDAPQVRPAASKSSSSLGLGK